jgi:hypothetical protein
MDRNLSVFSQTQLSRIKELYKAPMIQKCIVSISNELVDKKLVEKQFLVPFFLGSGRMLMLKSNMQKDFLQVGGNFLYSFLVCSMLKFRKVYYLGSLSSDQMSLFSFLNSILKQCCSQITIQVSLWNKTPIRNETVACLFSNDQLNLMHDWRKKNIEWYLSKELVQSQSKYEVISNSFSIMFNERLFLVVRLRYVSIFKDCVFMRIENDSLEYEDLFRVFSDEYGSGDVSKRQIKETINEAHKAFLIKNKEQMILHFIRLLELLCRRFFTLDDDYINVWKSSSNFTVFSLGVYLIIYRYNLSSLLLSLISESIEKKSLAELSLYLSLFKSSHTRAVNESMKIRLRDSFYIDEAHCRFTEFDGQTVRLSVEEETEILNSLIPDEILIHNPRLSFVGKTGFGGNISISEDVNTRNDDKIREARCFLTLRHEICHKKWLMYGSGQRFMKRTPPYKEMRREAGNQIDSIVFQNENPKACLNVYAITVPIAEKILSDEKLKPEEVTAIFFDESLKSNLKTMEKFQRETKVLCTGRVSRIRMTTETITPFDNEDLDPFS